MYIKESVITSKGQTTVPKAIREELHLEKGAKIKPAAKPATVEEMDDAIAEGAIDGAGLND